MASERITCEQAVAWARAHGAVPHVVDGSAVHSVEEALRAIGEALGFPDDLPDEPGHDLDPLFVCLTDLSWLPDAEHVLVWAHHQVLAQHDWNGYHRVRSVLEAGAGAATGRRLTVVFTPN